MDNRCRLQIQQPTCGLANADISSIYNRLDFSWKEIFLIYVFGISETLGFSYGLIWMPTHAARRRHAPFNKGAPFFFVQPICKFAHTFLLIKDGAFWKQPEM